VRKPPLIVLPRGAANGMTYWLLNAVLRGNEPLPVTIRYRFGDSDYLSLIYALSRFQFHEFVTVGLAPQLFLSFSPGISMFYALSIALQGCDK
jgi:hypothetical protein